MKPDSILNHMAQMNDLSELRDWIMDEISSYMKQAKKQCRPQTLDRIEQIKSYISENLSDPALDINAISQKFYISYHHLCAIFKNKVGITLNDYIIDCRMRRAQELMKKGITNVSFLAATVGFSDVSYFSRCFKKHFGASPSKFLAKETTK